MSDLLFDTPWWLLASLAAVGVGLLVSANRRSHRPTLTLGTALLAAAVLLGILSWLVDTDREKVEKGSRRLVESVQKQDWKTFRSLLLPDAALTVSNGAPVYHDAEQITEAAKEARQRAGLQSVVVRSLKVEQTGPLITASLSVLTLQEQTAGQPLPSTWQFDWANGGDGWGVHEIRALSIGNFDLADDLRRAFPPSR